MFNFSRKIAFLFVYWVYTSSSTTADSVLGSSTDEAAILGIGIDNDIPSCTKADNVVQQTTEAFKNVAYTLFKKPKKTWLGSVQYCSHLGGSLVDILTEEEHHFIVNLTKNAGFSSEISTWTGGHDINSEGEFKWIRNEGKVNETFFAIKTEIQINKDQNCLAFSHYRKEKFKLSPVLHCENSRPFACKFIRSS